MSNLTTSPDVDALLTSGTNAEMITKLGAATAAQGVFAEAVVYPVTATAENGAAAVGVNVVRFRSVSAFTLTEVRASCKIAPTGSALIIDVNNGGTSVLSTKLSVDIGETTSTTSAVPAVISSATIADDAVITIDIDQVGSTVAGTGVKVSLYGTV